MHTWIHDDRYMNAHVMDALFNIEWIDRPILPESDKMVVSLLDYGAGNVRSVRNAIKAAG